MAVVVGEERWGASGSAPPDTAVGVRAVAAETGLTATMGRWRAAEASTRAVIVAGTLAVLAVTEVLVRSSYLAGGFAAVLLLALSSTLPLALVLGAERIARSCAAVALSAACVLALGPFRGLTVGGIVAQLVCVYVLGRAGVTGLGGLFVVPYVVIALGSHQEVTRVVAVLVATLASAAAATGIAHHVRSTAMAHSATERAFADTLLEHAARGERARIARELHDVVAHHISMIAVQAETARLTTPGLPAEGASRLLGIGDTARTALTEMRRLLGVLREDADTGVQRRPQPGIDQLLDLVDESRDAGDSQTRLIVSGPVGRLDPGIQVTAYRIVQEALTNARRHAPGAAVDVELRYGADDLAVRVRDNGPGPAGDASGHGLLGMRERAATVGGTLVTGPAPGGGFLVEARLPVRAEAPA